MYVESHTKRQVYNNAKAHNVHHLCLCLIFDQTTVAQEQKSLSYIYPFEARLFWFMAYRTRNITFGTRLFWFMLIERGIFLFAV